MTEAVLAVDFNHKFTSLGEVVNDSRVSISLEAIQGGFINTVGANRLSVLLAILSYMDKDGHSYVPQRKLAEITGQSINTITKIVGELLEIKYNNQPVLERVLTGGQYRKKSVYSLCTAVMTNNTTKVDNLPTATVESKQTQVKAVDTLQAILTHFLSKYQETFKAEYPVNWSRDKGIIKTRLLNKFEDQETLIAVIDFALENYRGKWGNSKYPLPTLSMLGSWLANTAFEFMQKEQKAQEHKEGRIDKAVAQDETEKALGSLFNI